MHLEKDKFEDMLSLSESRLNDMRQEEESDGMIVDDIESYRGIISLEGDDGSTESQKTKSSRASRSSESNKKL